jgi:hypothetical protein
MGRDGLSGGAAVAVYSPARAQRRCCSAISPSVRERARAREMGSANERGRDVTPSELHPKQTAKPCHQHHVYVIMRVIKCEDKFLVTKMINENVK